MHLDGGDTDLARLWARQEARAQLGPALWQLAGGRPGTRAVDVGCGPGFFTMLWASLTGPTGHVHAVDVDAGALAFLRARLDPVHHAHVTTEALDIERAPLPDLHPQIVFCLDALHHMSDLPRALAHMRAPGAILVVCEFDPEGAHDLGPPLEMRMKPEALQRAMREAGWTPGPPQALQLEHYAVVAR